MKKILLSLLAISAFLMSDAQYYYLTDSTGTNPGNINTEQSEYPSGTGGLPAAWATVLSGTNATPTISTSQTIPFTFNFNGGAVTSYKAISNGTVTFAANPVAPSAYGSVALPSTTYPDSSICIVGIKGDGANDNIMSQTFGTAPNRQHWIFFTSYSPVSGTGWTYWSIVLEETTNNIYIVDQRSNNVFSGISAGIQINSSTAIAAAGLSTLNENNPGTADNRYYGFYYGTQPTTDVAGKSSTMDNIVILNNGPFNVTGKLQNRGSATVTSYDMNYKVGTGTTVTANVTGASILNNAQANFSHPTTWSPSTVGSYQISAWASNINGNSDLNMSNDTITFIVDVVDTIINRKPLLEVFTSSTCGPCVAGNTNMDDVVVPTISNYTIIKYQQNFPGSGDPYFTTESVNRRGFYGINSIPRMEIDGGWDLNAANFTKPIFDSYQQVPSFIEIKINSVRHVIDDVIIEADIIPHANLTGNLKYHMVVTEKETVNNTGTNGETEFFHVMMDMIPNENGNSLTSLMKGVATNINTSTNLATSNVEEMTDLKVVIFVQDMTTMEVYQSEWADVTASPAGLDETELIASLSLYPNPSNGIVTLNYVSNLESTVSVSIINMIGELVYSENGTNKTGTYSNELDLSNLPKGVYMVNVKANNAITTKKLIIQ